MPNNRITIGIFGQMKHGKSTVARLIQSKLKTKYGKDTYIHPFAKGIKDIVKDVYGMDYHEIEKYKQSDKYPPGWSMTMRQALQVIGTECFRAIKDSTWVEHTLKNATHKIIDDGRFINEAKAIQEEQGVNILVYRLQEVNFSAHPSEKEMFEIYSKLELHKENNRVIIHGLRLPFSPFHILLSNCEGVDELDKKLNPIVDHIATRYELKEV